MLRLLRQETFVLQNYRNLNSSFYRKRGFLGGLSICRDVPQFEASGQHAGTLQVKTHPAST